MKQVELAYKTITKIYTGNADGKVDTLRTTGLMGSLRWWFEVLVRGFGGLARDPVGGTNIYKPDEAVKYAQLTPELARQYGLDDAAYIFGATNWRRRFRLTVVENQFCKADVGTRIELHEYAYTASDGRRKYPAWYLDDTPIDDQFTLSIRALHPQFDVSLIAGLLAFIEQHGGLGAKNQHGFGVIGQIGGADVDTSALTSYLTTLPPINDESQTALPSLRNMFFVQFDAASDVQRVPYELKYALRSLLADRANTQLDRREHKAVRHFVMGSVKGGKRQAAKIKMSLPYGASNRVRVWGWLPQSHSVYNDRWDRDAILNTFYRHIRAQYTNVVWREFDSDRDTQQQHNEILDYFADLLEGGV